MHISRLLYRTSLYLAMKKKKLFENLGQNVGPVRGLARVQRDRGCEDIFPFPVA